VSDYYLLPGEVQKAFEGYASCMLRGMEFERQGSIIEADEDFVTVTKTAEDLYEFLVTALNNKGLIKEVIEVSHVK